jgi:cytochrome c biogenesis protein CcmG, thiol:disulfide interchange protein DsbE
VRPALRRSLQIGAVALLVALIGLFANTLRTNETTVAAQLRDGKAPSAPDFRLARLDRAAPFELSSLRGSIVLVNFWASWCVTCRDEAPLLNQVVARYGDERVAVVGVDTQDFTSDARAFARTYHIGYPVVHDGAGDVTRRWGVGNLLPVTFLVDRTGHVRHIFDGEVTGQSLARELRPLMREQPA